MKRFFPTLLFCSFFILISAPAAWGAGFLVFEQGTKAMGMAGAFTATADDPTAIFNNPAGITQLPGSHVSIGSTLIRNDQKYSVPRELTTGEAHEEMNSRTFILPHLYVTQELNDKMTFGFGYYSPFGIGTNWKDSSIGNSVADEAHLKTFDFNPNLAYKVNEKLSLSLGFHYTRAKIQIIRQVGAESFNSLLAASGVPIVYTPVSSFETLGTGQLGRLKLDARGGGWAYNLGVLYKINDTLKVGFSYRSDTKIEISRSENTVEWNPSGNTLVPLPYNPILRTRTNGKVKVGLPGIFLAGISCTAKPNWNFEFDVQYTTWNHFNDLNVDLKPGLSFQALVAPGPPPVFVPQTSNEIVLQEDWENGWGFHGGTEYKYTDNLAVRAGYFYDKNPIPDRTLGPILPDSDRHNFSMGFGYTKGDWTLDGAYMWSNFENRRTDKNYQNFNASYKTNFHLMGITLTRKL